MENRFGVKDFFVLLLLAAVIVMIALAMKQYDRQYTVVEGIRSAIEDQNRTLNDISRQLAQGVRTTGGASATAEAGKNDPFARIKAATTQPGYARGDWFVEAFPVHLSKITYLVSTDLYSDEVASHVIEGLVTRDPVTLDMQPLIAESWDTSSDGLTITFHLRHDVKFSDGVPLTAKDVVFSYNWIMNPKIDAPRARAYLDQIASLTNPDDYTVVVKFKEPYFQELVLVAGIGILPEHFISKFTPEEYNKRPGILMGTGPYRLEDPQGWTPGTPLVLVRNDRYWGMPSGFDRLVYREVENEVARLTTFTNGDIDFLDQISADVYRSMLDNKDLLARTQHFAFFNPSQGESFLAWNEERGGKPTVFADKRVRRAMTMLLDRERMSKEIYYGLFVPADGPFYMFGKQHAPDIKPMPYDPDGGIALLKAAGFTQSNGLLKGPDGQPFRFKLTYPTGRTTTQRLVLFAKDALAKVGIVLEPDPLDWSVFSDHLKNHNFDAITLGWSGTPEDDIYQMFSSTQITGGGDNFISYKNPELDKLMSEARRTVDPAMRMPLWHQCHHILYDDQPYTWLFVPKQLAFVDGRIRNIQVLPIGLNSTDEWWVPADKRKWVK